MKTRLKIVSGDPSVKLWNYINTIDNISTGDDIQKVLYLIGLKMQELETEIEKNRDLINNLT